MNAGGIAQQLGATRQGKNWRAPCPCGCGYSLSLADGENGGLLAFCFGGCAFDKIIAELVQYGLLDDEDGDNLHVSRSVTVRRRDDAKRIAHARQLYDGGGWDERIVFYLRSRGIHLTSPVLRFTEQAPHRLGARLPAMLAPISDVKGEQIGTHLTYLRFDGASKVDLPKEYQRECRGVIHGGAIRLAEHDPNTELVIAEGVETALAAMQLFGLVGWAAVSAGGLKTVELPSDARRILVAGDNDASGVGQRNALAAHDRLAAEGRQVRIKLPPDIGDDFNDVLIKRRGDARL
jgi:hypothetical protein